MAHDSLTNVSTKGSECDGGGIAANMKVKAELVIGLAALHADNNDSARSALDDAKATLERDRYEDAYGRAMTSLAHSVGVFHCDYQTGKNL